MDDIILNVIVLVLLVIVGGGVFLFVRRKKSDNEQKLRLFIEEQGWRHESIRKPLAWGLRVTGPDWILESLSESIGQESGSGSSNIVTHTEWWTEAFRLPDGALLIGPKLSSDSAPSLGGFGQLLAEKALKAMMGSDAHLYEGIKPVEAGSAAFRTRYAVWSRNDADVEQFFKRPAVEQLLIEYPGRQTPLIKLTSRGLKIEFPGQRAEKAEEIKSIAALGNTIAGK